MKALGDAASVEVLRGVGARRDEASELPTLLVQLPLWGVTEESRLAKVPDANHSSRARALLRGGVPRDRALCDAVAAVPRHALRDGLPYDARSLKPSRQADWRLMLRNSRVRAPLSHPAAAPARVVKRGLR